MPGPSQFVLLKDRHKSICVNADGRKLRVEHLVNDVGYRDSTGYHYYVKDYRGDVRAVVADDGTLEEVNHYYPYGMLHGPSAMAASVQPCKYTGKELDRQAGLDLYDSRARQLDPLLGRTTTQDPMAEKYSGLSPYLWCAGNPIINIDEGGDSTAVLYLPGLIGHLALLIQNDDGKWAYYSMNGNNKYTSSKGKKGGKPYQDRGKQTFNSVSEFLNSNYNKKGTKKEVLQDRVNNYGYIYAFVIPTTQKQDKIIREKFLKETHQSYNLLNRQCAQVVQKALNAGGIRTTIMDFLFFDDYTPTETAPYRPANTFRAIRDDNPHGKLLKKF